MSTIGPIGVRDDEPPGPIEGGPSGLSRYTTVGGTDPPAGGRRWLLAALGIPGTGTMALLAGGPWWLAMLCSGAAIITTSTVALVANPLRLKAWLEDVEEVLPVVSRVVRCWRAERATWRRPPGPSRESL